MGFQQSRDSIIYKGDRKNIVVDEILWNHQVLIIFLNTVQFKTNYFRELFCYILDNVHACVRYLVLINNILILRLFNHLDYIENHLEPSGNSSIQPRSTPSAYINMILVSMDLWQYNQSSAHLFVSLEFHYNRIEVLFMT